jgi:hypothetical protein
VCLIIRLDGTRGEGFSYCFNWSWRNNQVTQSHSTDFSANYLEPTGGIANGDKGTGAEGGHVGPVNAYVGIGSLLAKRLLPKLSRVIDRLLPADCYLFLKHVRLTLSHMDHPVHAYTLSSLTFRIIGKVVGLVQCRLRRLLPNITMSNVDFLVLALALPSRESARNYPAISEMKWMSVPLPSDCDVLRCSTRPNARITRNAFQFVILYCTR